MTDTPLVVISPVPAFQPSPARVVTTKKFVAGMELYKKLWDGPVLHLCAPSDALTDNLDNVEIPLHLPAFDTICVPFSREQYQRSIPSGSMVLTSVGERFNSVSDVCRQKDASCIYITENTLKTRLQMISENRNSVPRAAWQSLRQTQQELAQRKAIASASGVQCNGLPTFNAYRGLANSLLFFDTRTESTMLATEEAVERKIIDDKLRLVFSGRLTLMKGVDDLIEIAERLRNRIGDIFDLSIFGDGDYKVALQRSIENKGLGNVVRLRGSLDFQTELIPEIKNAHLFVCCHRQGDPSCTYLETMACGVPIIGYSNEAWSQLSRHSGTGWVTPLGKPDVMADCIVDLSRELMIFDGLNSLKFASQNTFEETFQKRIDHLKSIGRRDFSYPSSASE